MKNLLLILILVCSSALTQELNNNETVTFQLNGNALSSGLFVDVPITANNMKVEISNGITTSDFDLFMKFGSDFTTSTFDDILDEADYYSAGADADEFFSISTALNVPLRAGKWYIAVFNFNVTAASINLGVSYDTLPLAKPEIIFIFDQATIDGNATRPCDIAGWNDPAPFTPVGGNNATTLGGARRIAALKAAELMTENLQSNVPLVIQGCWPNDLNTSPTSATLANAQARSVVNNTPGVAPNIWYPIPLAERLAGTQGCKFAGGNCDAPTILINFNPRIDTNAGLGSTDWYYGLDVTGTGNDIDFISTALHEMTHGLGFSSGIFIGDEDATINCPGGPLNHTRGTLLCNQIDIFSSFLVKHNEDDTITPLQDLSTDAARATAMSTPTKLLWNSELVKNSQFNTLRGSGIGLGQLYSPFVVQPGSSVSHLTVAYTELMVPFKEEDIRTLGLATPILWDIGWDPRPKVAKVIAGFHFDPAHNGHGFVIEPIVNSNLYFVVFYTYKDDGTPEWYTSLASLEDNVLNINMDDNSLLRFIYDFNVDPTGAGNPNTVDATVGTNILKIDFNEDVIANSAACNDGTNRADDRAVASWQLGNQQGDWCIEPIVATSNLPVPDFGGTWWTGNDDDGWGMSLGFTGDTIIITIYYFDTDGSPRWVLGTQSGFVPGEELTINMLEFSGFARDAAPIELATILAGTVALTINSNTGDGNDGNLNVDINYQGIEGGNWNRTNVPFTILTVPH